MVDDNNNDNTLLQEWEVNNKGTLSQANDDKSDNHQANVYLLLIKMKLVGHVLNYILDHIFVGLVTTILYLRSFFESPKSFS